MDRGVRVEQRSTPAPTAMNSTPRRFEGGDHAFSRAIEYPVYPVKIWDI
jgi:hypothetical protein